VRSHGLVLRQVSRFPDDPVISLSVVSGAATLTLRVRVPGWVAGPPVVALNGMLVPILPGQQGWIALRRRWQTGDLLEVTLPMRLAFEPTPDFPAVQAVTYGPVVLSGVYGTDPGSLTPTLEVASVQRTTAQPMTFEAISGRKPVRLIPVSRAAHEYYSVYWLTE